MFTIFNVNLINKKIKSNKKKTYLKNVNFTNINQFLKNYNKNKNLNS